MKRVRAMTLAVVNSKGFMYVLGVMVWLALAAALVALNSGCQSNIPTTPRTATGAVFAEIRDVSDFTYQLYTKGLISEETKDSALESLDKAFRLATTARELLLEGEQIQAEDKLSRALLILEIVEDLLPDPDIPNKNEVYNQFRLQT